MTLSNSFALFGALVVLASIPSISVFTVATRSATSGLRHGMCTALGIVAGDIIFILIALWGLSHLAEKMGTLFVLFKSLGGTYLIGLGIGLWRTKAQTIDLHTETNPSLLSSLLTGLLITLADQKAILFYLGFFPAFVDLAQISYGETGLIMAITIVAVGGVKVAYAVMADRARGWMSTAVRMKFNRVAGSLMMGVGLFLIIHR